MSNLLPPGVSIADAIALLRQVITDQRVSKYVQTASLTVMIYDNLLTLPQEARNPRIFNPGKRLTLNLVDFYNMELQLVERQDVIPSHSMACPLRISDVFYLCKIEDNLASWGVLIFLIPLQIVIVLRTIALWNKNRVVLYVLTLSALATDITLVGLLANVSANQLHFTNDVQLKPLVGCYAYISTFDPKNSTAGWGATMVFDFAIFILTFVRAVKTAKYARSPLLRVLIVDGFVYYSVMLTISIVALTFSLALDVRREILLAMVPPIFKACYCILGSRIAIRLRESALQPVNNSWRSAPTGGTNDIELSTFAFTSGAPGSPLSAALVGNSVDAAPA